MVARELEQFFGSFSPDGRVQVDDGIETGEPCAAASSRTSTRRCCAACWERGRLPRRRVRGGPGVRARRGRGRLEEGLRARRRRCCTRTTIGFVTFMRRYFDEYRGTSRDHRPRRAGFTPPGAGATSGRRCATISTTCVRPNTAVRPAPGVGRTRPPATTPAGRCSRRSGRARTGFLARCVRRLSLEGTARATAALTVACPAPRRVKASGHRFDYVREHHRRQPAPLSAPSPGDGEGPLAHRLGDPALPARQRRAHDDLQHRRASWSARATRARSGCTTPRQARRPRGDRAEREIEEHFARVQRRRLHRLRRLARRGRRAGHRLADRVSPRRPCRTAS